MRGCTFISNFLRLFLFAFLFSVSAAQAQGPEGEPGANPSIPSGKKDEPALFDQSSPYLEYGDFNSHEDEDADTQYFQYGRFFAVNIGASYQTATGNRGLLYQPAFTRFDLGMQYWFDFHFAMYLGIFFATHDYTDSNVSHSVKFTGYGLDLKYYFDVRDASAALSFCNPFILLGAGAISETDSTAQTDAPNTDSTFSVDVGGGLEFPITHKKTFFILEAKYNTQNFADTNEQFQRVSDLSGGFFTLMGQFMFTW